MEKRSFSDVLTALRNAKDKGRKCSLLIGAGASATANIPLAGKFVDLIKERHPEAYERAPRKSYPDCMAELADGERRELIAEFVDCAKINWAHVAIAQLMAAGYVDRVLTTNFDPLVSRACAMAGLFPAIYDFAASQNFNPHYIADQPAVFHLHGQRTGFVLLHTAEEVSQHKQSIAPLFEDAGRGRVWIVVGYSGENDPVVEHLSSVKKFDFHLFWVGYKDHEPAAFVREKLLTPGRYAWWIDGYDADSFFVTLAQKLGCFPPRLISQPIDHLEKLLDVFTDYSLPGQSMTTDVTAETRQVLKRCRDILAGQPGDEPSPKAAGAPTGVAAAESSSLRATQLFMAGEFEKVVALFPAGTAISEDEKDVVAWSWISLGNNLTDQANQAKGNEADRLFAQAEEKYQEALRIKPDQHGALYNWGTALLEQAERKQGDEADHLFAQAGEKYQEALRIKPDQHEALNNWGNALSEQAKRKQGDEAGRLFALAGEKYQEALRIKPDQHEALYNWGNALSEQAKRKQGDEAVRLFTLAGEKYQEALRIKPDTHEALKNWGHALMCNAMQKKGDEAARLRSQAAGLFEQAERIVPGYSAYNLACVEAHRGSPSKVLEWLTLSREKGKLPSKKFLLEDPDFKPVRRRKWFQDFLKSLPESPTDPS